ncbi:hypothetical protein GGI07_001612 [Coemansia sp. Benny D115]|nr:hypothetical protein GGI07_001612 [Coemansia sp. Benny D115]
MKTVTVPEELHRIEPEPKREGFVKDPTEYFVQTTLRDNRVVVFSKPGCPHCHAAKELLQKYRNRNGLRYLVVEMDNEQDLARIKRALNSLYQRTTFPSVFVDAQCVGGNSDLQDMDRSGGLARLFDEKGLLVHRIAASAAPAAPAASVATAKDQRKFYPDAAPAPAPAPAPAVVPGEANAQDAAQGLSAAQIKVRQLVKDNRVMVFSKTYCPYSKRAKRLLETYRDGRGLEFAVFEADRDGDPMAIKAALGAVSGHYTFPNIFVDAKSIGGSDDLAAMHESGDLAALLKEKLLIV